MDFTGIWLELTALYWDLLGSTWFHETSPAFARFDIGSTEFDRVCPRRPQPPTSRPKPSSPSPVWLERLEYDTKIHHGRRPMTTPSPPFYAPFDCPGRRRPLPLIYDRISAAVASLHAQLETPSSRAPPPPPPPPQCHLFFVWPFYSFALEPNRDIYDRPSNPHQRRAVHQSAPSATESSLRFLRSTITVRKRCRTGEEKASKKKEETRPRLRILRRSS